MGEDLQCVVGRETEGVFSKTCHSIIPSVSLQEYHVAFTGHSLGGAMAALAAFRTILDSLRSGDNVILYTFGEPRVGNAEFAMNFNRLVPTRFAKLQIFKRFWFDKDLLPSLDLLIFNEYLTTECLSFRIVHGQDIVPHLPPCLSGFMTNRPCGPGDKEKPFHHGVEVW